MKLLVVGITYLSRINWDKYITMARLYPDSEFRVVFPRGSSRFHHNILMVQWKISKEAESECDSFTRWASSCL